MWRKFGIWLLREVIQDVVAGIGKKVEDKVKK